MRGTLCGDGAALYPYSHFDLNTESPATTAVTTITTATIATTATEKGAHKTVMSDLKSTVS